ncbi:superfamily II DNA/RNA helicase [Rhodoblastus acidophilus]|uniref:DEAD/DEAH box helicase n=1 Tax=Rhodoblastus acidophilus TaxID=1074 RepID=UPI002224870A|nr:DEAD/DEAH box helicase [Rhodoblastus acidophilus]MCW2282805.1 superfamily II DNA/RNA helicase [Rhodoblastus acidophilus]MCW2331666.1 superfamily II DNA/RNA helicase [Rhodoblastus acidophilus]
MQFSELGLSEKVLRAVEASGYTTPTPIQAQAIPFALTGRDVLGIAQTGTGKTAAFVLPMLSRLEQGRARARVPRTLILEPTRELAAQVEESFNKYGAQHKLNVALLIGGVSFGDQETKIMRGADVLIATPGRLLDFFERGKLLLTGIEILVIDEADRMLDMGFIPDIEKICKLVPFTRQTLFFSATMPPEITRLTEQFLHNPARVEVARAATTATTITQGLIASHGGGDKRETLRRLLREAEDLKNAIVFCNRKRDVAIVHKSLVKHGFPAGCLHGDMDQPARMASLDAFKNGDIDILVCSDVAARGLDIPDVSHVFNFDAPSHPEDYVHRIGRTGRAGRSGVAYTIITADDAKHLHQIQDLIKKEIDWLGPKLDELAPPEHTERDRARATRTRDRRGGRVERSDRPERGRRERSDEPRPERAPREHVAAEEARPLREKPVREPREPRPPREQRAPRRREREDDGPAVIGFGDHLPGFLMRPVRAKAKRAE